MESIRAASSGSDVLDPKHDHPESVGKLARSHAPLLPPKIACLGPNLVVAVAGQNPLISSDPVHACRFI